MYKVKGNINMRLCKLCQVPMNEEYHIKVNTYGTPKIERGASKPDGIKVAICPTCGEVYLYIDTAIK